MHSIESNITQNYTEVFLMKALVYINKTRNEVVDKQIDKIHTDYCKAKGYEILAILHNLGLFDIKIETVLGDLDEYYEELSTTEETHGD